MNLANLSMIPRFFYFSGGPRRRSGSALRLEWDLVCDECDDFFSEANAEETLYCNNMIVIENGHEQTILQAMQCPALLQTTSI
jgi:hypothetical protein